MIIRKNCNIQKIACFNFIKSIISFRLIVLKLSQISLSLINQDYTEFSN